MIYLVIIGLVLLGLLYEMYWKRKDLPPGNRFQLSYFPDMVLYHICCSGPTPLPLIGNLIPIIWNFPGLDVMHKWRKEYGKIFSLGYHSNKYFG